MFDTRPLERFTSIMILFPCVAMPLLTGLIVAGFGLADPQDGGTLVTGGGCCVMLGTPVFAIPLLALLKWSRTGQARPFLEAIALQLGSGEVTCATWLWSMLSPRIEGVVDGHPFTLSLRRQAGILSPGRVGGQLAIFGWLFTLRMGASVSAKVGFGPAGPTMGAGLLGLSHPVQLPGLNAWTGGTERGQWMVGHPAIQEAARRAVTFGGRNGSIVKVGPDAIAVTGFVRPDVTPEMVVAFLRDLATIANNGAA